MRLRKMFALLVVGFCVCLGGCGTTAGTSDKVTTSRITKDTVNAIKADEKKSMDMGDFGTIPLPEDYRWAVQTDNVSGLVTYYVWNNDKANAIADVKDGRAEGDYEEALRKAWEERKAEEEKKAEKAKKKKKKKGEPTVEPTVEEVFVFDTGAYIVPYDANITMYAYSGTDLKSPIANLSDFEIRQSMSSYILNSLQANITDVRMLVWDMYPMPCNTPFMEYPEVNDMTRNGKYFVSTFTCNSGAYKTTTYGSQVYPYSYFGICLLEKENTQGSIRKWYCFVFTNDGIGDMASEELYNGVIEYLSEEIGIKHFYSEPYDIKSTAYSFAKDYRNGRSYEQLYELFDGTRQYYFIYENEMEEIKKQEEAIKDDAK